MLFKLLTDILTLSEIISKGVEFLGPFLWCTNDVNSSPYIFISVVYFFSYISSVIYYFMRSFLYSSWTKWIIVVLYFLFYLLSFSFPSWFCGLTIASLCIFGDNVQNFKLTTCAVGILQIGQYFVLTFCITTGPISLKFWQQASIIIPTTGPNFKSMAFFNWDIKI